MSSSAAPSYGNSESEILPSEGNNKSKKKKDKKSSKSKKDKRQTDGNSPKEADNGIGDDDPYFMPPHSNSSSSTRSPLSPVSISSNRVSLEEAIHRADTNTQLHDDNELSDCEYDEESHTKQDRVPLSIAAISRPRGTLCSRLHWIIYIQSFLLLCCCIALGRNMCAIQPSSSLTTESDSLNSPSIPALSKSSDAMSIACPPPIACPVPPPCPVTSCPVSVKPIACRICPEPTPCPSPAAAETTTTCPPEKSCPDCPACPPQQPPPPAPTCPPCPEVPVATASSSLTASNMNIAADDSSNSTIEMPANCPVWVEPDWMALVAEKVSVSNSQLAANLDSVQKALGQNCDTRVEAAKAAAVPSDGSIAKLKEVVEKCEENTKNMAEFWRQRQVADSQLTQSLAKYHSGLVDQPLEPTRVASCNSCPNRFTQPLSTFSLEQSLAAAREAVPYFPAAPTEKELPPPRPYANFTVPLDLQERGWPLKPDSAKGVIISLVSVKTIGELQKCYAAVAEHLLVPYNITWMLVYERFPADATKLLLGFIEDNKLEQLTVVKKHPKTGENYIQSAWYKSPEGAYILMRGVILSPPKYLEEDPALLDRPDWMGCMYRRWTFDYVFYNTFFVYHLSELAMDELKGYDYFMKMDTDIVWQSKPPFNPFTEAGNRACVFAHTAYYDDVQDCHYGAYEAMISYTNQFNIRPRSANKAWCRSTDYFYGNMVMASLRWYRSVENAHFLKYLFESHKDSGYFKNRWGDQPIWPKSLCMFFEFDSLREEKTVCDFGEWRNKHFRHY